MADERQILVASLREHFEGIVEAADLYLQSLSGDMAGREELEAARGANSVLKSECSDWRKRAVEANKTLKDLKRRLAQSEERLAKTHQFCLNVVESLSSCEPELYKKYRAALNDLEVISSDLQISVSEHTDKKSAQEKASASKPDGNVEKKAVSGDSAETVGTSSAHVGGAQKVTEAQVKSEAKVESGSEKVAKAQVKSEAKAESGAEKVTEAQVKSEVKAESGAEKVTEAQVKSEAKAKSGAQKATEAQVKSEAKAESGAEKATEAQIKSEAKAESGAEKATETQVKSEAKAESDASKVAEDRQHKVRADNKAALKKLIRVSMSSGRGLKGIKAAEAGRKKAGSAKSASETVKESAETDSSSSADSSDKTVDIPDPPATSDFSSGAESPSEDSVGTDMTVKAVDPIEKLEAMPEEPIENNSRLKLPFLTEGRLKDSLEVTLDRELGDRLSSIDDIIEQTEADERLSALELLSQFGEDIHFILSEDKQLIEEVEEGLALSEKGEYDAALAKFARLLRQDGALLQPCLAILHNYVGIARWEDAYKTGMPLLYDTYSVKYWDKYIIDMVQVLIHKLVSADTEVEIKKLLFELALIHAKYPVTARKFLRLASEIPDRIREDAAIHYYLLKLGVFSESIDDTVEALQEITSCPELFDELFIQVKKPVNKGKAPVLNMIEALYLNSKDEAKEIEDKTVSLVSLGPVQISPSDIERFHSQDTSGQVLSFMLDELFPRAGFKPPIWPERFKNILEASKLIPLHFEPAKIFERLNARTFKFKGVDLRYYDGKELFFVKAAESEKGKTFILHSKMAELTPIEQQFIVLRKCFQLYHQHTRLWHARLSLDDTMVCRLLSTVVEMCVENGAEVAASLVKVVKNYDADTSNLYRRISETITRLYRSTGDKHFLNLKEFLFAKRPFTSTLDGDANRFAAKSVGITEASYGLARLFAGMRSDYEILAQNGFCALYADMQSKDEFLRRSLQLLWTSYLQSDNYI
ncbi:MAG: hypothetical protein ACI38Q_08425 [Candidatus Bruticola sp.]